MDELFKTLHIPFDEWVRSGVSWLTESYLPFFEAIKWPIALLLNGNESLLRSTPPEVFLIILFLIAWQLAGMRVAVFAVLSFCFMGLIGVWQDAMTTVALITTSVAFCIGIGVPIGIITGKSDIVYSIIRPILDVMQTLPSFVYLVPVVMLFGIGNVPGVFVTIFFALPPIVRLTNLGIRQVPESMIEAAYAFGSSPLQVLVKIQLPLAVQAIMTGVNQTLMMSLAMVTISSMIAVEGLGMSVLRGIGRLDVGIAATGGVGIVLLAMVLDRVTQALGRESGAGSKWFERGPIGLVISCLGVFRSGPAQRPSSIKGY